MHYHGQYVRPEEMTGLTHSCGLFKWPIDIVTFMSCQMSVIELAYEFSLWPLHCELPFTKVANHIIASQGSVEPTRALSL